MQDTLHQLGIYWPKLLAQTINFGIILFILWKFAYRPVLAILEQRRQKIAESMTNAERIKVELAQAQTKAREIMDQASLQAGKMIEEARAAAARVQELETQKAVTQAADIITKAREAAAAEHARMLTELRREVGRLVVSTTSKVTGKVLTPDDQQRLTEEANRQVAA